MPVLRLKPEWDAYALSWAGLGCNRGRGTRLLSVAIVDFKLLCNLLFHYIDFYSSIDHVMILII